MVSQLYHIFTRWLILMIVSEVSNCATNYFCNANFEGYPLVYDMPLWTPYLAKYNFFTADNCWYPIGTISFTVQAIDYFNYNKMIDMQYMFIPFKICQKLQLTNGSNYTFSFDYGIHQNVINATITVQLNQKIIATFKKDSRTNRIMDVANGSFTAQTTNQFCIKTKQNCKFELPQTDYCTTLMDNFNCTLIVPKTNITNTTIYNTINDTINTTNNVNTTNNTNTINTTNENRLTNRTNNVTNIDKTNNTNDNSSNSSNITNDTSQMNSTQNSTQEFQFDASSFSTPQMNSDNYFTTNISASQCQTVPINFLADVNDQDATVIAYTQAPISPYYFSYIQQNAVVIIEGQIQKDVSFALNGSGYVQIIVHVNRPCNINNMSVIFAKPYRLPNLCLDFVIYISCSQIFVIPLSDDDNKIIKTAEKVANNTINFFFSNYGSVRYIFFSYFVANFICYFNVIILYNFLLIQTQPQFSYKSVDKFVEMFFNSNSNMFAIAKNLFQKFNFTIQQCLQQFSKMDSLHQKLPQKINGFKWFQAQGMTYNFIANNLPSIVTFCLCLIKIIIIRVLRCLIRLCYSKFEFKLKKVMSIFIMQSFSSTTILIVAAETCFLSFGNNKFTQKLNQTFHNIFFFFVPLLPFAFLLNAMWPKKNTKNNKQNKQNKQCKQQNTLQQNQQKAYKKLTKLKSQRAVTIYYFIYYVFHLVVPSMIIIRNKLAFFIVTSILILSLTIFYFRYFCNFPKYKRIFTGCFILVILTHHICYLFLFVVELLNFQAQVKLFVFVKLAGVIVIYTILVGSLIQICDILLQILIGVINIFKFVYRKICKSTKQDLYNRKTKKIKLQQLKQKAFTKNIRMHVPKNSVFNKLKKSQQINPSAPPTTMKKLKDITFIPVEPIKNKFIKIKHIIQPQTFI